MLIHLRLKRTVFTRFTTMANNGKKVKYFFKLVKLTESLQTVPIDSVLVQELVKFQFN